MQPTVSWLGGIAFITGLVAIGICTTVAGTMEPATPTLLPRLVQLSDGYNIAPIGDHWYAIPIGVPANPERKVIIYMTNVTQDAVLAGRDRPDDELEITAGMISAGVSALRQLCPFDFAFPVGGEDDAVEAVLKAAWRVRGLEGSESIQRSLPNDPAR